MDQTSGPGQQPGRPGAASADQHELDRLVEVVALLREHCPWMGALTHESLVEYLVEESYELVEAVETGHSAEIQGELGDVLLQVVLHARLAQEAGGFGFADVARGLTEKMIRRSPHVFRADGTLQDNFPATVAEIEASWHHVKKLERPETRHRPFDGIPAALPALALAQKSLDRASRSAAPAVVGTAAPGESADVHAASGGMPQTEEELGELLLAIVRDARAQGLDAERALRGAVRRFQDGIPATGP